MNSRHRAPRRARIALALALLVTASTALASGALGVVPPEAPAAVPRVADGFVATPLAALAVPTAIEFGPGGADGPDLYAATYTGNVMRVALEWSAAGPVARGVSPFGGGFSQPLGLAFDADGALYVSDSHEGDESGRVDGRVTRVLGGARDVIVDGLPNGRHNTNNLRFGPDGRLFIANGNPNDSGQDGAPDVFPYSGAILSVDAAEVAASPAVLRWHDEEGNAIPAGDIATHPVNADFASKVRVLAHGFRNVYDVAFSPEGVAYTATNGADLPASQDLLYRIDAGTDYGFPFCYNVGPAGGVGASVAVEANPLYADDARCAGVAPATALLGWHVCATGLDFPAPGPWSFPTEHRNAVYVGECGPLYPESVARNTLADPSTHNTGHKVVQVVLDDAGEAVAVRDFVTGLALPTDVRFGPDGAMYVADAAGILRVAPALPEAARATPPPASTSHVVAGPGAIASTYATPAAAAQAGGSLTFVNLDIFRHNVVALDAYGPDSSPWCGSYAEGRCPLFWSALVGLGGSAPVLGLENLEAGRTYTFYCTLHPGMRGTLAALPGGEGA